MLRKLPKILLGVCLFSSFAFTFVVLVVTAIMVGFGVFKSGSLLTYFVFKLVFVLSGFMVGLFRDQVVFFDGKLTLQTLGFHILGAAFTAVVSSWFGSLIYIGLVINDFTEINPLIYVTIASQSVLYLVVYFSTMSLFDSAVKLYFAGQPNVIHESIISHLTLKLLNKAMK